MAGGGMSFEQTRSMIGQKSYRMSSTSCCSQMPANSRISYNSPHFTSVNCPYMPGIRNNLPYTCARCLRASQGNHVLSSYRKTPARQLSQASPLRNTPQDDAHKIEEKADQGTIEEKISGTSASPENVPAQGAMSRRLQEAAEDALLEGGRAGRKAVEESGFSEDLKQRLLERVESTQFRSENTRAFAEAGMSSNVGRGSRDIATGQAWSGTESTEDAVLRMLDDAHKPLKPGMRGPAKIPDPIVDLRLKRGVRERPGQRLANARDKTSIYAVSKDAAMTEKERENMKQLLKDRFAPGARAMPNSFRGLAALANERIEDAIARGQFKNIPRGKAIERDPRADNPFIDTTEYIMNKMIQRQDIVPPWIEKQQELVKAAAVFRARLRNDWKRHAARTIASRGGTLQDQMRIAESYAASEKAYNPKVRAVEDIAVPSNLTSDPVMVKITQEAPKNTGDAPAVQVSIQTKDGEVPISSPPTAEALPSITSPEPIPSQLPPLFRIPAWEAAEQSYLNLAINDLNSKTRSYNLMAPDLAKKSYFSLERELRSCYADIAPQLAQAIKERAARPPRDLVEKIGHRPGSIMDKFGKDSAKIYDSKRPLYGWKEFWTDLFGEKQV